MPTPKHLASFCFLIFATLLPAQNPPSSYTITEAMPGTNPGMMTIYRSDSQVLIEYKLPAQADGTPASHSFNLYDLKAGTSNTWNPESQPANCSAGTFSGDWGDPFAGGAELTPLIAKGDLKPVAVETLNGIPVKVYAGVTQGMNIKVWFDSKDNLVMKSQFGAPGAPMTTMADIRSISFATPPASMFALPPTCAGVKPPPTAADLIAAETGDDPANYVNAIYGPGSKTSCSILIRVVAAKTMAPMNRKFQAAIDLTYDPNSPTPPSYVFGVGEDGTSTYSGGGLHEITSQIRNGMIRLDNPPAQFMFGINIPTPHRGANVGLIYRQCFAPVTVLYDIIKDPTSPADGSDYLYAKSGKFAAPPAQ